ncbi:MAG: hypothetical protein NQU46_07265 [Methanolinea sp.]|nr:hypothetical protein [Methanolinea sp.]
MEYFKSAEGIDREIQEQWLTAGKSRAAREKEYFKGVLFRAYERLEHSLKRLRSATIDTFLDDRLVVSKD